MIKVTIELPDDGDVERTRDAVVNSCRAVFESGDVAAGRAFATLVGLVMLGFEGTRVAPRVVVVSERVFQELNDKIPPGGDDAAR